MLSTLDVSKYIISVCRGANVRVHWDKPGSTPRTNGKEMYLPSITSSASPEQIVALKQFVKHETSHIQYSDFDLLLKYKPTGLLMMIDNMIEDHRIDYLNDTEYYGDRSNTEQFLIQYQDDLRKQIKPDNEQFFDVFAPLLAWDSDVREDVWSVPTKLFHEYMSKEGVAVYDALHAGDYGDVLRNIRTIKDKTLGGEEVYKLAVRILKEIFKQDPKDHTDVGEDVKQEGKGDGEGEGESDGKGEGVGEGSDEQGDGEPVEGKKLIKIDLKNKTILPYTMHSGAKGEGINAKNYKTSSSTDAYCPDAANSIITWDFTTNTGNHIVLDGASIRESCVVAIDKATKGSENLAHQVRTKLQIASKDRYEYGRKSGTLHNSALYRATLRDAKGFNERIFKKKIVNDTLNIAVQVMVDCSGSMSGSKYYNAAASAVLLNDVISRVLRIPIEILGYTEMKHRNTIFTFKQFDRPVTTESLTNSFSIAGDYLLDNVDGESLMYGYNNLIKRKEKRKLMIVLSDGSPCGGYNKGDVGRYTYDVIKNIEKSPVEIVGIGVLFRQVAKYYKKWEYIEDAKYIQSTLLKVISDNIIKEAV